jgi:hypothetical protein
MGVVYEALDRERSVSVALKTLNAIGPDALYRFKTEFRALQDLRHRNVVDLGELIESDGTWFFTMELVQGQDILSYVRPGGELDHSRLRHALGQLAAGLEALHQVGLVHRDLKPSNIMVTADGRVVILDFGLVTDIATGDTSKLVVGTAAYMAPEQAASKAVGPAADWYSVGILLYEALTGVQPFRGSALEVLLAKQQQEPPPPTSVVAGVPADLNDLCTRALSFDPARRPTGAEVLTLLGGEAGAQSSLARGSATSFNAPFVGREAQLSLLRDAFGAARRDGRTVTVEVRGESGVGKSALIGRFTRALRAEEDAVVLRGRCYERESVPYKAFDGVVDSLASYMRRATPEHAASLLPRNAALLPRVFPVLGRVEAIVGAPRPAGRIDDPHELRARIFAALRELLAKLSDRRPLVVVIDDMQWTDADSLLLLADLVRPPHAPAMLLLLSSREAAPSAERLPGDVRQIALTPLPAEDANRLARILLERAGSSDPDAAAVLAEEAGGHPLFLHELVRHAAVGDQGSPRAARLDDAVWSRASQLPKQALHVLELTCVAGHPLPEETFAVAAGVDTGSFARHLSLLRTAHLVLGHGQPGNEDIEPYHDRIRETVSERIPEDERVALHGRIALALEVTGHAESRPDVALRHFDAAGDRRRAAYYAGAAARRATDGLAFDHAAALWQAALQLGDHSRHERRRIEIALADALAASGRSKDAAYWYLHATRGADAGTRLDCRRKAAEQLLTSGYLERGIEVIEDLLRELGTRLPATPRRALASLAWYRLKLRVRGLSWKQRDESEVSDDDLRRIDTYHAVAHGLGAVDTIRGMDFQARALAMALKAGEPSRVAVALLQEAAFRASAGGKAIAAARPLVAEAKTIDERSDDLYLTAWRVGVEGVLDYFDGSFDSGRRLLAESERMLRSVPGAHWELSSSRIFQILNLKQMGAIDRLRQLAQRYLRDAQRRGDRYTVTSLRVLCGWRWLRDDDPAGARADLEDTSWTPPESGFHLQHFWKLEMGSEIALYEGSSAEHFAHLQREATRYARSLLSRIMMIRCADWSVRGRLAVATAAEGIEPRARRKLAAVMADRLSRVPAPFAPAFADVLRGAIAAQQGDTETAVAALRTAESVADQLDMALWRESIRYRLGDLLGGDEGAALIRGAMAWMTQEGISRPERMIEVLAPGFPGHHSD